MDALMKHSYRRLSPLPFDRLSSISRTLRLVPRGVESREKSADFSTALVARAKLHGLGKRALVIGQDTSGLS